MLFAICVTVFSCTDQGCIDADDFGEYESETIEVSANNAQDSCSYDPSRELSDPAQGPTLIACFTGGDAQVTDETGTTKTTDNQGCEGFDEEKFRMLCVDMCVQECLINSTSGTSNPQPNWVSTNKRSSSINSGVTIRPGAEIKITVTGEISLGDKLDYDDFFIKADTSLPNSFTETSWTNYFFDVSSGQSLNLNFSGKWNDGSNDVGAGTSRLSSQGNLDSDSKIYNGARRLVAYLIPHPSGYDFDTTQSSEKLGSKSVPLLPDAVSWKCTYTGTDSGYETMNQAQCVNNTDNGYTANGYNNVSDQLAAEVFPISSTDETSIFGTYGGVVKWSSAILMPDNRSNDLGYDALNSISCNSVSTCTLSTDITQDSTYVNRAVLLDQTAENGELSNPSASSSKKYAFKVSFRNINPACTSSNLKIKVADSSGNVLSTGSPDSGNNGDYRTISVVNSSWSSDHISLEHNQKIVYDTSEVSDLCRKSIVAKFRKYHDIEINQSGFVSFTTLNASSGNCILKGRIINPYGSFLKVGNLEPDFYEYGNFLTPGQSPTPSNSPSDPLTSLALTYSNSSIFWTQGFFVRRGQIIRFSPESWDNTFTTISGLNRQCGTGMVMKIDPRPALLCRGTSGSGNEETIFNPACTLDYATQSTEEYDSGTLLGCKDYAPECSDPDDSQHYCPIDACKTEVIGCINGTNENGYAKTNCELDSHVFDASNCNIDSTTTYDADSCLRCSNLQKSNALLAAKISINGLSKCYDLESYQGKVANIPSSGFSTSDLEDQNISKGATNIGSFNGVYGNFENFSTTGNSDSFGNTIFETKSPIIFSSPGRLRFFVLDGSDFSNAQIVDGYSNNSSASSSYNGSNGFRVTPSGMLTYSNGEWLQARLCEESSNSSYDCSGSNPDILEDQPSIIEIETPTESGQKPVITSGYKFDAYGNIIKTSSPTSKDCTIENSGVNSITGSYFYCHTYSYYNEGDEDAEESEEDIQKLRLTFQILDPEIANCNIDDPESVDASSFNGIRLKNAYYEPQKVVTVGDETDVIDATENIGHTCPANKKPGPDPDDECQMEFYCGNKYSNNSGKYYVNVKIKSPVSNGSSDIIGSVIKPVIEIMDGPPRDCSTEGFGTNNGVKTDNPNYDDSKTENADAVCTSDEYDDGDGGCQKEYYCKEAGMGEAERVYIALISDIRYKAIVTTCLVLMITFYGLSYLMGVSEISHSELSNRVIKISLIYLFIGENGWYWFDQLAVKFFKNGADYLAFLMASSFDSSPEIQNAIATGDYYDKSILFSSVDKVFNMFFSPAVQKKISALLFASIFGVIYLLIILSSFMLYVYAVANAVLLYLSSQVFISILFTLGPIFFVFTLFSQTKDMFSNWLNQLIGLSLQQIFLLTTLAFFNMLMYEVVKMSLGYKICWDEVWTINIITRISLMSFWTIASLPPRTDTQSQVGNIGNAEGIPSLFSILFIWVIASLMNKFIGFMTDLASSIGGSMKASDLGSGVADVAKGVKGKLGEMKKDLWKRSGGKDLMQNLDKSLFNSGEKADAEKAAKKKKKKEDKNIQRKMKKDGKKAVSDYKKKNMSKLAAMDPDAQKKLLDEVKSKAEIESGKKSGLSEEDAKKLQNKKGFDLAGEDNLAALAASYAYERVRDGSFKEALSDKSAKTSFSTSEKKEGLKGKTKEERAEILKGSLEFDRSNAGKALKMASDASKMAGEARKAVIDPIASKAVSAAASAASSTYNAASNAASGAKKLLESKEARDDFKKQFALSAKKAGDSLKNAPKNISDAVANAPKNISKAGKEAMNSASEAVAKQTKNLQSRASQLKESAKESIKTGLSDASNAVSNAASNAVSTVKDSASFAYHNPGSAMKEVMMSPLRGLAAATNAASKAAESTVKGIGSAAEAMTTSKEDEQARQELVKAGIINDYDKGTRWAMSSTEKQLVQQRKKENQKLSKATKPKFNAEAMADAELDAKHQDALDDAEDLGFFDRMKAKTSANIKRNLGVGKSEALAKARKMVQEKTRSSIEGNIESATQELEVQESASINQRKEIASIKKDIAKHKSSDGYKARQEEIKKLDKIASQTFSDEERKSNPEAVKKGERLAKAARAKIANLESTDTTMIELNEKLKKSTSSLHTINDRKDKIQSRISQYKDMLKELPVEDKNDRAEESQDGKDNPENSEPQLPTGPKPLREDLKKSKGTENKKYENKLGSFSEEEEEESEYDDDFETEEEEESEYDDDFETEEEETEDQNTETSTTTKKAGSTSTKKISKTQKDLNTINVEDEEFNEDEEADDITESSQEVGGDNAKQKPQTTQRTSVNPEGLHANQTGDEDEEEEIEEILEGESDEEGDDDSVVTESSEVTPNQSSSPKAPIAQNKSDAAKAIRAAKFSPSPENKQQLQEIAAELGIEESPDVDLGDAIAEHLEIEEAEITEDKYKQDKEVGSSSEEQK